MTRIDSDSNADQSDDRLPNLVTIVGRGVPGNFEITVDGEIEAEGDDPRADGLVVTKRSAEGSIDVGTQRFRFSGSMANLRIVDWNGVEAAESACAPTAHVEYGVDS